MTDRMMIHRFINQRERDYIPTNLIRVITGEYYDQSMSCANRPLFITWNITNRCNMHCRYCSLSDKQHNETLIDAERIAESIISIHPLYVSILGGESTLIETLPRIIQKLTDSGTFVEIVTNGTGITDDFIGSLCDVDRNLLRIEVSLDSVDKDINDRNRSPGSYDAATSAIKRITKASIRCRVQMTLYHGNFDQIKELYKYCCNEGVSSFGFSKVAQFGKGTEEDIDYESIYIQCEEIINNEDITRFEKIRIGENISMLKDWFTCKDLNKALRNEYIKCNGARTKIHIEPDGHVYPCDFLIYPEFYMGRIWEDFWYSESAVKFRTINRTTKEGCSECSNFSCNTGCFALSYKNFKDTGTMNPNCKL